MRELSTGFGLRDRYARKFAAFLLVTVLLVGGVGGIIYVTVDDEITAETEESLAATATTNSGQIDNWVQLTSAQVESLTRSNAVRNENVVHLQDQLARVSERNAIASTYFVNSTSGEVLLESGQGDAVTEDGQFTPAVADRLAELDSGGGARVVYSDPFTLGEDDQPRLVVAGQNPTGGRLVVAVVDLATLSRQIFGTSEHGGEGTATVLTRDGTVVLADDQRALLTEESVDTSTAENGSGYYTQAGTDGELAVGYLNSARESRPSRERRVFRRVGTED